MFHWNNFRVQAVFGGLLVCVLATGSWVAAQDSAPGNVAPQDDATRKKSLPRKTVKALDEIVLPALLAGDDVGFLASFTPIIKSARPQQFEAIDTYAAGFGFPSLQKHFAEVAIRRVEQGMPALKGKQHPGVALYLSNGVKTQIEDLMSRVQAHPIMQDPLRVPAKWQDSRNLFWEVHVFKNEFKNAARLGQFAIDLIKPYRRSFERSDDPAKSTAYASLEELGLQRMPTLVRMMKEREAELRLVRFNQGYEALVANGDFEQRFIAALAFETDAEVLIPLLEDALRAKVTFQRPQLQQPDLLADIKAKLETGREIGDDVAVKARLFRGGLHWWLRGRYGMGPLANGLLKSEHAMNSKEMMDALYMPRKRPNVINMYDPWTGTGNGYERRHFYTWAVEFRELLTANSYRRKNRVSKVESTTTDTRKKMFW